MGLAGWIETASCCGLDRSLVLKGRNIREARSRPQSSNKNPQPSGFQAVECGVKTRPTRTAVRRVTQGGALRLRGFAAALCPGLTCCGSFGTKTDRAFWVSRRDPAFSMPQRGTHEIAQGRASGEATKRCPGLIGPRLATLCSGATFSGAAKREPFDAKKKLLPDQIFFGPGWRPADPRRRLRGNRSTPDRHL